MKPRTQVVIPARFASQRLPEKLLLQVGGRSIIQHTYVAASQAAGIDQVLVAVDDPRIAQEVADFGGEALMTSPECQSGTDRVAEVALRKTEFDIFVNVQGDEPEIEPQAIEEVTRLLVENPDVGMATVATPIRDPALLADPNCVKVVCTDAGEALYFSRSAIPAIRDGADSVDFAQDPPRFWQHVGLYAYRRDFLLWFAVQPVGTLEQTERLEQLRALQAGRRILVGRVTQAARGIDTLADFEAFRDRYEAGGPPA